MNLEEGEDEIEEDGADVGTTFRAMLKMNGDETEEDGANVSITSMPKAPTTELVVVAEVEVIPGPTSEADHEAEVLAGPFT